MPGWKSAACRTASRHNHNVPINWSLHWWTQPTLTTWCCNTNKQNAHCSILLATALIWGVTSTTIVQDTSVLLEPLSTSRTSRCEGSKCLGHHS